MTRWGRRTGGRPGRAGNGDTRSVGVRRKRSEAVDDGECRAALLDQLSHLLEDARKAILVEHGAEILVEDEVADRFRVEETERLTVVEDLVEGFGHVAR